MALGPQELQYVWGDRTGAWGCHHPGATDDPPILVSVCKWQELRPRGSVQERGPEAIRAPLAASLSAL